MNTLLTIDAGNSNIVLGLYKGDTLEHQWRIHTDRRKLPDEYANLIDSLLTQHNLQVGDIDFVAISNVVPALQNLLETLAADYFKRKPFFVSYTNTLNMTVTLDNEKELGADLIAAAAAAIQNYGAPCIIIDLGTATTFTAVNEKAEFLGGAIAPGLAISSEALYNHAPHLPRIKLETPPSIVGTNTIHSMQAGIYTGYEHMVSGIVADMKKILGPQTKVIATGGLAKTLQKGSNALDVVDPHLVLDGIKILFEMNVKGKS